MPLEDSPRRRPSGLFAFVWAVFFFFIFALLVVWWVRGSGVTNSVPDKRGAARQTRLQELRKADQEKLAVTAWVDEAKQVARIPIADAKKLIVAQLKSKQPAPSQVKVEPPLPMPPPPDPNASEPPPPPLPSAPQGADTLDFSAPPPAAELKAPASPAVPAAPAPATVPTAPAPSAAPAGAPEAAATTTPSRPPLIRASEASPTPQ